MNNHIAKTINLFKGSKLEGLGPLGLEGTGDASGAAGLFNRFISVTIGLITAVAFIWFVFLVITGALGIMTAGGDKGAVQKNYQKILNGIIGLVVLIASLFIVNLVGTIFGLENIILNPAQAIIQYLTIQ